MPWVSLFFFEGLLFYIWIIKTAFSSLFFLTFCLKDSTVFQIFFQLIHSLRMNSCAKIRPAEHFHIVYKAQQDRGKQTMWLCCQRWLVNTDLKPGLWMGRQKLWIKDSCIIIASEITISCLKLCNWKDTSSYPVPNILNSNLTK